MESNTEESPYCSECESCGYDGCCSYLKCFKHLIDASKCDNGDIYFKDAWFNKEIASLSDEIMNKLKSRSIGVEKAIADYDEEWHKIYHKVYQ